MLFQCCVRKLLAFSLTLFVSCLTLQAQTVPGATSGSFAVDQRGGANYRIPIAVVPGIAGLEPELALNYSSHGSNGLLGMGWSLAGLSTITRCAATIDEDNGFSDGIDFDGNDRFCLDGKRLRATSGIYGANGTEYRTEQDDFTKVISYGNAGDGPSWFKAWTKAGLILEFGNSQDSKIEAQGKSSVLFWALNQVKDRFQNYISITYNELGNSEFTPAQVLYAGNEALPQTAFISIDFSYEDRHDSAPRFIGGTRYERTKRLKQIEIKESGQLYRSYTIDYRNPETGWPSHIDKITECGSDGSCFSPTSFVWQLISVDDFDFDKSGSGLWQAHSGGVANNFVGDLDGNGKYDLIAYDTSSVGNWVVHLSDGTNFVGSVWAGHSGGQTNNFVGDYNADGRSDIAAYAQNGNWHVCLSTGSSFNCSFWSGHSGGLDNVHGDFNADGRTDMAGYAGNHQWHVCLSTGNDFDCSFWTGHAGGIGNNAIGDFNGDGKADLTAWDSVGQEWHICLSNGADFDCEFWVGHLAGLDSNSMGDFNGDGKTDLAAPTGSGTEWHVCLSTGVSFECDYWNAHSGGALNNIVGDFNGDGKSDLAGYSGSELWHVTLSSGVDFDGFGSGSWLGHSGAVSNSIMGDFNGDGKADIAGYTEVGLDWHVTLAGGDFPNLISKITDGHGKETVIGYLPITDDAFHIRDSDANYPRYDFEAPLYAVATYAESNGLGTQMIYDYRYGGAEMNVIGRGFRGFRWIEQTDQARALVTTTFYNQNFRYAGRNVSRVETRLLDNTLVKEVDNSLNFIDLGNDTFFPYLEQSTSKNYEIDGTLINTAVEANSYDNFGNLTNRSVDYGSGYSESNSNTYLNDSSNWIIGRLLTSAVTKTAPNRPALTRAAEFSYDPTTGALASEIMEPNEVLLKLEKSYLRDVFGNITQSDLSDSNGTSRIHTTSFINGRLVDTSQNAEGHTEDKSYQFGLLTEIVDPNDLLTEIDYDGFGREILRERADGTLRQRAHLFCDASCPQRAIFFLETVESGKPDLREYYDLLDRVVRKEVTGFDGRKVIVDSEYNGRGLVHKQSLPYYSGDPIYWTSYAYDELGREIERTLPGDRTVTSSYQGLTKTIRDPLQQSTTQVRDRLGQIISITDALNNSSFYEYDSFGNVIATEDAEGNRTEIQYDIAGNRSQISEPNSGVTSYQYNAFAELVSQTDQKGQTIQYSYDKIGRLVEREEQEGITTWHYDSAINGVGKIAREIGTDGFVKAYSYDQVSRPVSVRTKIESVNYRVNFEYDSQGRISLIEYPRDFAIEYIYNSNGYLEEVRRQADNHLYWQALSITPWGESSQTLLGNGVQLNKTYDSETTLIENLQAGTVQDLEFEFDDVGNLSSRSDLLRGLSEEFEYDPLNRLVQSEVIGGETTSLTYNKIGNITSRSDMGTYSYAGAGPHALTSIQGIQNTSLSYDANGNCISKGSALIDYTSFNKVSLIANGQTQIEFSYAPDRSKYLEITGSPSENSTRRYVLNLFEHVLSESFEKEINYIYAGKELIAIYSETHEQQEIIEASPALALSGDDLVRGQDLYLLKDHLGSVHTILDQAAQVLEVINFDSWGLARDENWSSSSGSTSDLTRRGFSGHEHLSAVGLVDMGGRIYDPETGRFLSPDPLVQTPFNAQNLNRYSYVVNNPLSKTDPNGLFFKNIAKFFKKHFRQILAIGIGIGSAGAGLGLFGASLGTLEGAIISGAGFGLGSSFSGSLLYGQSFGSSLRAGLLAGIINGLAGGATFQVPEIVGTSFSAQKVVAHGVVSGVSRAASGGRFEHGFISGAFADVGAQFGLAGAIVAAGAAEQIASGSFANGAVTASFVYLFNHASHSNRTREHRPGQLGDSGGGTNVSGVPLDADGFPSSEGPSISAEQAAFALTIISIPFTGGASAALLFGFRGAVVLSRISSGLTFSAYAIDPSEANRNRAGIEAITIGASQFVSARTTSLLYLSNGTFDSFTAATQPPLE